MDVEPTGTIDEQYRALRDGVGIAVLAGRTRIELTGSDRAKFLHNFCTNDVKKLTPGTGCEAFITNVQGKILGFVNVFCHEQCLVIDTVAGQAETLIKHLDRYLITEDVKLRDASPEYIGILVAGVGSEDFLASLLGSELPRESNSHIQATVGQTTISIARVAMVGGPSFVLTCPRPHFESLVERLVDHASHATTAVRPLFCTPEAVNIRRVEAGTPEFGVDITNANLPQEVGRNEQAISFVKGCYLGQETVARIDALGHVNRNLCGVKFAGQNVPPIGTEICSGDKVVGAVTSAVFSPSLNAPLALAFIRREHAAPGTMLQSNLGPAEVIGVPLANGSI